MHVCRVQAGGGGDEIEGDEKLRRAAVAIVITSAPGSDEACILLTRRPVTLKRHSGQYALPGGMLDPGEDALQAGLREMEEEIGLSLEPTDVMGFLDDFGCRSGFCITPIVFWAGAGAVLDPAPEEVDVVFHIPLEELNPFLKLIQSAIDTITPFFVTGSSSKHFTMKVV